MRWFSGIAILLYLCLLCTPQAIAVHDPRLSPLADAELLAVSPTLQHYLNNTAEQADSDPPLLPAAVNIVTPASDTAVVIVSNCGSCPSFFSVIQPRAPPVFSSH